MVRSVSSTQDGVLSLIRNKASFAFAEIGRILFFGRIMLAIIQVYVWVLMLNQTTMSMLDTRVSDFILISTWRISSSMSVKIRCPTFLLLNSFIGATKKRSGC